MIFKVYAKAVFGNMDCCQCSLSMKFKNWWQLERNAFLQQDFPKSVAIIGMADQLFMNRLFYSYFKVLGNTY